MIFITFVCHNCGEKDRVLWSPKYVRTFRAMGVTHFKHRFCEHSYRGSIR